MTLTSLRRLVMAGNVVAVAAAGASAWYALQSKAAEATDWAKKFPVKKNESAEIQSQFPGPKDEYVAAITWPQGDKPVEVKPDTGPKAPPPDPFKTKYHLNGVFDSPRFPFNTYAQLTAEGLDRAFSVGVGERIPQDPTALQTPTLYTPWRLKSVKAWDGKGNPAPCSALFRNDETGVEAVLEMVAGNVVSLDTKDPAITQGPPIGPGSDPAKPRFDQGLRAVIEVNVAAGTVDVQVPQEEIEYLGAWGEAQAKGVSIAPSRDARGNPDGFVIKAIAPGSRAADYGFKPEDKVISVNGEAVTSTADALAKGKQQYADGSNTFQIKAVRAGKEINFTFHAPPPKTKR